MGTLPKPEKFILTNDASAILIAEYEYIAQTAFQANEDRARISQFFFVTFATFIAAILSSQLEGFDTKQIYIAFSIVFILVSSLGALTLLQLARLRQAWIDSALAMNQIKIKFTDNYPHLREFFRWRAETIPPTFKLFSVGFILSVMVASLSGLAIGSSFAFYKLAQGTSSIPWILSVFIGIVMSILQILFCYWLPLRKPMF